MSKQLKLRKPRLWHNQIYCRLILLCGLALTTFLLVRSWPALAYEPTKVYIIRGKADGPPYTVQLRKRLSWLPGAESQELPITVEEFHK